MKIRRGSAARKGVVDSCSASAYLCLVPQPLVPPRRSATMNSQESREFRDSFSASDLAVLGRLNSPYKIQKFLWSLPYSADERYRCPRTVIRDRAAHCFDGALFAA